MVNPTIPEPRAPGHWVDGESCICGDSYSAYRCGSGFHEAYVYVRSAFQDQGFITRRVILWGWHCLKMIDWFQEHEGCVTFTLDEQEHPTYSAETGLEFSDLDEIIPF